VQYEVEVNGRPVRVVIHRHDSRLAVTVDGREVPVDAVRVDAHTWSLLVGTSSFEVTLAPGTDAGRLSVGVGPVPVAVTLSGRKRWGRKDDGGGSSGGNGPDQVVAVMAGKVVRILAKVGDTVHARQALVVIEAMKMENELRAARDGVVKEVRVREGQSVDAGAPLVVVAPA
jgi:biotin carboxyl carrier protein